MTTDLGCPACLSNDRDIIKKYRVIDGCQYYECYRCYSIYADSKRLFSDKINDEFYDDKYWKSETSAAKERSFGSSINRAAEVFFYARQPINRFLDIGSGPRYLLDALSTLMPKYRSMFYGVELYPPPKEFRSSHENYIHCDIKNLNMKFDAGVCIEVIEHLNPTQLRELAKNLKEISNPNAIYYFNSGQPKFVKNECPDYLDPYIRGHIISYSIDALKIIFNEFGFTVIPLPGRDWGFLVELCEELNARNGIDELLMRLWTAHPQNLDKLKNNGFGELMYCAGLESARCYLESAK